MTKTRSPVRWSEPGTRQNNDLLYPKVVAGDAAAREEMILSNVALVHVKVNDFLDEFPKYEHLRDDLISQGTVGLVTAVNAMVGRTVEKPNPTGFISEHVYRTIGEALDREATIRVPGRTYRRKKASGAKIDTPTRVTSPSDDALERDPNRDPRSLVELHDEILGCCETDTEKSIVRLRLQDRTDKEIAEILDLPHTTTWMLRRQIYKRFLQRNPEVRSDL